MRSIPAMYDLDTRLRIIEQFAQYNYTQVISLGMPPLEAMGPPEVTEDLAKAANEGMAELVQKYPHHFTGFLAALPDELVSGCPGKRTSVQRFGGQWRPNPHQCKRASLR